MAVSPESVVSPVAQELPKPQPDIAAGQELQPETPIPNQEIETVQASIQETPSLVEQPPVSGDLSAMSPEHAANIIHGHGQVSGVKNASGLVMALNTLNTQENDS